MILIMIREYEENLKSKSGTELKIKYTYNTK